MAIPEVESRTTAPGRGSYGCPVTTDLMTALATLESSITAPGALLRFHSTRRLVESHQSPVTFLVSIGLRDRKSLLCYRALSLLCFNASSQLLKLRIRPAKMERQPLAKVLAEHFLPPEMAMGQGQTKQGAGTGQGAEDEPLEAGTKVPTGPQIPSDPSGATAAGSSGGLREGE